MKHLLIILGLIFLQGCSHPGYHTRIILNDYVGATRNDIPLITSILQTKAYDILMIKEGGEWEGKSYQIKLEGKQFNDVEPKYIGFGLEYWCNDSTQNVIESSCKLEIRTGNPWEGRKPIIKHEIDKITDEIIDILTEKFKISEIQVRRAYTSPI